MFKELRFALYAMKKNIQSSAELRTSFLMNVVGMAINNTSFVIIWIFFVKSVGVINGWTATDIIALQGFTALSFGVVFSVAMGIRQLPDFVASGSFDRIMLSPKNLLVRVATSAFNASAVGDVVFGVVCLIIYVFLGHLNLYQIFLIPIFGIIGVLVFLATSIAAFSTSFFFIDANAVTNGFFELFMTPSLFHGGTFQGAMRFIFTFLIPSLLVGALPTEAVRDLSFQKLLLVGMVAIVWFILALLIFRAAVKNTRARIL